MRLCAPPTTTTNTPPRRGRRAGQTGRLRLCASLLSLRSWRHCRRNREPRHVPGVHMLTADCFVFFFDDADADADTDCRRLNEMSANSRGSQRLQPATPGGFWRVRPDTPPNLSLHPSTGPEARSVAGRPQSMSCLHLHGLNKAYHLCVDMITVRALTFNHNPLTVQINSIWAPRDSGNIEQIERQTGYSSLLRKTKSSNHRLGWGVESSIVLSRLRLHHPYIESIAAKLTPCNYSSNDSAKGWPYTM